MQTEVVQSRSRRRRGPSRRAARPRARPACPYPRGRRGRPGAGTSSKRRLGDELQPAVGRVRAGLGADPAHAGAGHAPEDLVRADGVERGEAVVQRDRDLHGGPPGGSAVRRRSGCGRRRRHAEPARERAAQRLHGPEPAAAGDGVDRHDPGLEREPGALDAQRLDVGGGRHPGLGLEGAGEVALAHARARGERGDRQVGVEVVGHPRLQLAQRRAVGRLRGELGAELGLAAGALDEDDEPAGDIERDPRAEVLLDEREREVHARGDARRRAQRAVDDEDRVALDRDRGVAALQLVAPAPVRRRAAPVEQARRGEDERAGTDGRHAPRPLRDGADGLHDLRRRMAGARATGDQQRVDRPADVLERPGRDDPVPRAGRDRRAAGPDDLDRVRGRVAAGAALRRGGEDVGGAGDVEGLDVGEGHHDDAAGWHRRSIARRGRGSKDGLRTDPATRRLRAGASPGWRSGTPPAVRAPPP